MKKWKLQPSEQGGVLPYPYFVDGRGNIGRQDFWRGRPKRLVGFSSKLKAGHMDVQLGDFYTEPSRAIGKFPVFSDAAGNWYTADQIIEAVKLIEDFE